MEVSHPDGGNRAEVSAAVDRGALHTTLPASLLTQMRIRPVLKQSFRYADGSEKTFGVGFCRIIWQGDEAICPVIFGPEGKYLMGSTTLDIFSLVPDPVNHTLVRVPIEARPIWPSAASPSMAGPVRPAYIIHVGAHLLS